MKKPFLYGLTLTEQLFDDTVYGGDFLANQPPVKGMCDEAPRIIHLMDRMGVMFSRTSEGLFSKVPGFSHWFKLLS